MRSQRYGLLPTFCGKGPLFLKRCTQFAIIASAVVADFFARAEALTGELRFCEAKWEFLKLPSNFSGESPERSAGDLPSPEKGLARLAYSLASGLGPLWGPFKTGLTCRFGRCWAFPAGEQHPRRQPRPRLRLAVAAVFFGKGRRLFIRNGPAGRALAGVAVLVRPGEGFG